MVKLEDVVSYLDQELKIAEIPDYSGAHNGLQLENGGSVTKVGAAVDASLPVIEKAVAEGVDFLLVHHGMFWQGVRPITQSYYKKLSLAMNSNLAIYSAHIPLDIHPHWGNNILLAQEIGMDVGGTFFDWKGIDLGVQGIFDGNLGELQERVQNVVGGEVLIRGKAEAPTGKVGIITGGAGSEVEAMAAAGLDTFITGEGPHWSYPLAEELGLNLLYAGHYATETFGVKRVMDILCEKWGFSSHFVDHPTGL